MSVPSKLFGITPRHPAGKKSVDFADFVSYVKFIMSEIIHQYLEDDRPWIIAFSGGKDSRTLLQLVFYALRQIPKERRTKPIHVLSNDTLVENPAIIPLTFATLQKVRAAAEKLDLPITVATTTPALGDRFWVNIIGRGYPIVHPKFRWCVSKLKIEPANAYITSVTGRYGEAIVLLGTRRSESTNRRRTIAKYERPGQRLRPHGLPGVSVFAPITELSTDEVWTYLLQVPAPWGEDNKRIFTVYKNSAGGECPLVLDTSVPSCGSRFGCWTCTLIEHDRSMEGLVDSGDDELEPLLLFRNWLKSLRDEDTMQGRTKRTSHDGLGPFTLATREMILRRLLALQATVGFDLIDGEELAAIQHIWNQEYLDAPSVARIYREATGQPCEAFDSPKDQCRREERALLAEICEEYGIEPGLIDQLVYVEKSKSGLGRRQGIYTRLDETLTRYLRLHPESGSTGAAS